MSYYNASLADILNALAEEGTTPRLSRFPARQAYARHQPYVAPQDEEDDDDSSDGGYYSLRYPDYYAPYFAQQGYRPRAAYRRQQVPQPQPQQSLDLADILNYLAGQGTEQASSSANAQPQASTAQKASSSSTSEKTTSSPVAQPTAPQPPKSETNAQAKKTVPAPASAPKPQSRPQPLHRHSTVTLKDPTPRIEISSRNAKNQALPYSPQTNVYETEKEYIAILAIPGATLSQLDIDFHPSTNEIVVKGTIPEPFPLDDTIKINELRTGSVERRIKFPTLPKIVDEQIKAKYQNGLLTIKVPKNDEKEVKPKRKVTIEEVPDEELIYEEKGGLVQ